jgi:hypothetical protein
MLDLVFRETLVDHKNGSALVAQVGAYLLWQASKQTEVHLRLHYERRQRKLRLLFLLRSTIGGRELGFRVSE